ncbi:MAG: VanZ family protein [Anaerocolumna sp.]
MEQMIMDIISAMKYVPIAILVGISISMISSNLLIYIKRRSATDQVIYDKNGVTRFLFMSVFYAYCFMIICLTLLTREPGSRFEVRLQIFRIFIGQIGDRIYAIENVLMFVPYGIMLPFISSKFDSVKVIIFIGFISSLTIEVTQYMTKRGFTELDDILNNVIGMMIGYLCIKAVRVVQLNSNRCN